MNLRPLLPQSLLMNVRRWLLNIIALLAFIVGGGLLGAVGGASWYLLSGGPIDGWIFLNMMFGAAPGLLIGVFFGGAYLTNR